MTALAEEEIRLLNVKMSSYLCLVCSLELNTPFEQEHNHIFDHVWADHHINHRLRFDIITVSCSLMGMLTQAILLEDTPLKKQTCEQM